MKKLSVEQKVKAILFLHAFAVMTVIITRILKSIWRTDYEDN